MVALSVATAGGLVWAGHDVITVDVAALGVDGLPGSDGGGGWSSRGWATSGSCCRTGWGTWPARR